MNSTILQCFSFFKDELIIILTVNHWIICFGSMCKMFNLEKDKYYMKNCTDTNFLSTFNVS